MRQFSKYSIIVSFIFFFTEQCLQLVSTMLVATWIYTTTPLIHFRPVKRITVRLLRKTPSTHQPLSFRKFRNLERQKWSILGRNKTETLLCQPAIIYTAIFTRKSKSPVLIKVILNNRRCCRNCCPAKRDRWWEVTRPLLSCWTKSAPTTILRPLTTTNHATMTCPSIYLHLALDIDELTPALPKQSTPCHSSRRPSRLPPSIRRTSYLAVTKPSQAWTHLPSGDFFHSFYTLVDDIVKY